MKTDLIVLKTLSLSLYKHYNNKADEMIQWLDRLQEKESRSPGFLQTIQKEIKLLSPHLELIIHE